MATYIQNNSNKRTAIRSKQQQTLENVAEEMLNGMFCHYEPPPPRQGKPGILRSPRSAQNTPRNGDRNVRWSDDPSYQASSANSDPSEMDFADRVDTTIAKARETFVKAGISGGCISPASVPHRESKAHSDVVFDDKGIPVKAKPSAPEVKLPSCIPPPSRREIFIPELCGVRINCIDDEAHLEELARSEAEARKHNYYMDMDDGNNSLVESSSSTSLPAEPPVPKRKASNRRKKSKERTQIVSPRFDVIEAVRSTDEEEPKQRLRILRAISPGRTRVASVSPGRANRSRNMSSDWDESIPIIPGQRNSSKSPSRRWSLRGRQDSTSKSTRRGSSRERRSSHGSSRGRSKSPVTHLHVPHPGLHPAHPLNQGAYANRQGDRFADEKQSMITAHRQTAEAHLYQRPDLSDKESFIGAYRQSFGDIPPPPPPPPMNGQILQPTQMNQVMSYRRMSEPSANKAETASMVMTNGNLVQTDPTVPRRQSYGRVGGNLIPITEQINPTMDPPLNSKSPKMADKSELVQKDDDLTWEERTRQAWERIRGGMSSLGLGTAGGASEPDNEKSDAGSVASNTSRQSNATINSQGKLVKKPPGILKQSSYDRRVTFGTDQEHIFDDTQNENIPSPASNSMNQSPVYPRSMTTSPRKTKKKFKGVKIITGLFNRGNKKNREISQAFSNDTARTEIASSHSMDSNGTAGSSKLLYNVQYQPAHVSPGDPEASAHGEMFSV